MPKFFLHLRDDVDQLLDPEGAEFASLEALHVTVLAAARELIASEVMRGRVNLGQRIDAEDEDGRLVESLPFNEAVSFCGSTARAWSGPADN